MRIVFVIPYFYPALQYGGQPKSCYELARALVRRGHSVTVVTTDSAGSARLSPDPAAGIRRTVENIEVFYYRNLSNYLAFRHRIFLPIALFLNIRHHLSDCDVLHIHELRSTLTVAAYRAARSLGVPFVLSPHGGLRWLGKENAKRLFDNMWGKAILGDAARLVAISPLEVKDAQTFGVGPERVRILPNLIFPEDYANLPRKGDFRRRWNIGEEKIVLFLGRLHWIKGADLLIRAMAGSSSNARLVIAGPDDGQESQLRQILAGTELEKRTTFTGYLDHAAKLESLVDADVVAIPSRSEVFAITAVEALVCGTPVIMSSSCGLFPLPGTNCGVFGFKNENVGDLVDKLRILLNEDCGVVPSAGRAFVLREFGPDAIAERAEVIYEEAIRRG